MNMKKKILGIIGILLLIAIGLFMNWSKIKYSFWTNLAATGWADKEQLEFKLLNDKYGKYPGNPMTISLFKNEIGIWVSRVVENTPKFSVGLELYKNIKTNKLRMQAIILNSDDLFDKGVPEISMEIPFTEFDKILHNWIDNVNLSNFIMAAKQEKWKSTNEDTTIHLFQIPKVTVKYKY